MTKLIILLGLAVMGCAREPDPRTYAVPSIGLAEIKTRLCHGQTPQAAALAGCHGDIDR